MWLSIVVFLFHACLQYLVWLHLSNVVGPWDASVEILSPQNNFKNLMGLKHSMFYLLIVNRTYTLKMWVVQCLKMWGGNKIIIKNTFQVT